MYHHTYLYNVYLDENTSKTHEIQQGHSSTFELLDSACPELGSALISRTE